MLAGKTSRGSKYDAFDDPNCMLVEYSFLPTLNLITGIYVIGIGPLGRIKDIYQKYNIEYAEYWGNYFQKLYNSCFHSPFFSF